MNEHSLKINHSYQRRPYNGDLHANPAAKNVWSAWQPAFNRQRITPLMQLGFN
jgi:hypothetical protein